MSNLCANAVAVPLTFILQNSMAADKFDTEWRKANIVPFHYDKQKVSTYRPVSLLLICSASKIFAKLISNKLFKFFEDK